MTRLTRGCRPATALFFPLAVMAAFLGLIFGLQLVSLLVLVDLGTRMLAAPYEDDDSVITAVRQVRIANDAGSRDRPGIAARPAGPAEVGRAVLLVARELERYGAAVLPRLPLRRVVLCADLTANDGRRGGLALVGRGVILLDVGGPDREDIALRRAIHHEIGHVLDGAFRGEAMRDERWSRLNPAEFTYGGARDRAGQLEVLGEDPGGRPDAPGFVTYYAMTSPREDRAEVFSAMMTDPEELRVAAAEDPILRAKCRLLRSELVAWAPAFAEILRAP